MISFLSRRIALFLRDSDIVDDETAQVCQYGFEIIISTLVGFFTVFLIGICCGELLLAILFYVLFVGVRLSAGGYHASSHLKCKLLLCVCCLSTILTTILFEDYYNLKVQTIIIIFYLLTIFLFSPIEHPNAPLDNFTMKRNRGISIIVSFILALVIMLGYFEFKKLAMVSSLTLLVVAILMLLSKFTERRKSDEKRYQETPYS